MVNVFIVLIPIVFVIIFFVVQADKENNKKNKIIDDEKKRNDTKYDKYDKITDELNKRIEKFNAINKSLDEQYGRRTWAIPYRENGSKGSLRIYDDHKILVLDHTKIIRYDEIKSCQYEITDYTLRLVSLSPHTQTVTKTDTASMLTRAAVGGVVAGPVGAIIGGVTAKKKTEEIDSFSPSLAQVPSEYSVRIDFVNDEQPYLMSCGYDESVARRIVRLINSIIEKGYFDPENH